MPTVRSINIERPAKARVFSTVKMRDAPAAGTSIEDVRKFRRALGSFATGITIVTTRGPAGEDIGLTANSFNSVSLDPPMVLWSLSKKAKSLASFSASGHFAIHVLASQQEALAMMFATQGADKFAGLAITRGAGGIPLLPECSARFECRTAFQYDGGDHVIFVGEVEAFEDFNRPPLIFHAGRYALAIEKPAQDRTATSDEGDAGTGDDFLVHLLRRAHFQLFLELDRGLERHGLSEDGWFVLSHLGKSDTLTVTELDRLLWHSGRRVTYELVASLTAAGFVKVEGGYDPHARVALTDTGMRTLLELAALAKATESHAERNLGFAETQILKQALRRLIRDTEPRPPGLLSSGHPE
jgi:3-hydroxy-9,10-secoandrosta-1,3,5(10)-triene-9,17-dione monooxygenase reductase component